MGCCWFGVVFVFVGALVGCVWDGDWVVCGLGFFGGVGVVFVVGAVGCYGVCVCVCMFVCVFMYRVALDMKIMFICMHV